QTPEKITLLKFDVVVTPSNDHTDILIPEIKINSLTDKYGEILQPKIKPLNVNIETQTTFFGDLIADAFGKLIVSVILLLLIILTVVIPKLSSKEDRFRK
ncbi:hypothetical protein ACFLWE_00130, partial [Chloroflexota bacterium]